MLSERVVEHCRSKGWWYEEPSDSYVAALTKEGLVYETDAGRFFAHAEDGPEFLTSRGRFYQLAWHILNTKLEATAPSLSRSVGLEANFVTLDGFEGGAGYFYDRATGEVILLRLNNKNLVLRWESFSLFLEYFFELDELPG